MFRKVSNGYDQTGYVFDAPRLVVVFVPLMVILFIMNLIAFHGGLPYEIDQIKVHMSHALKTNNIDEKTAFMEETLVLLEPYHGNTGWLFPTEVTDIDVTKRILKASIDEIKTELETQDQSRWAFLPHNELNAYLNSQIEKSWERISSYAGAYYSNPATNTLSYILFISIPVGVITIASLDHIWNGGYNRPRKYFFVPPPPPKKLTSDGRPSS